MPKFGWVNMECPKGISISPQGNSHLIVPHHDPLMLLQEKAPDKPDDEDCRTPCDKNDINPFLGTGHIRPNRFLFFREKTDEKPDNGTGQETDKDYQGN
jgi:hypothetical protein